MKADDIISLGDSVISLRSISDAGDIYGSPRHQGNKGNLKGKKNTKNASPYGTPSKSLAKATKKNGREMWITGIQNGGGLSNESKTTNTWKNSRPKATRSNASAFLMEQLTGIEKPSRPSSATHRVGGTGPVYKDAESYYDEIQALKRTLKQLRQENNLMKAKIVRLEDETVAKSKKIDELLNPQLQSNDIRRTLTSKNAETSEVVMSLRRKVHKLEENLRSKENETRKMASDMKFTDMEEIRVENEMCMYEISRMHQMLEEMKYHTDENTISQDVINDALKDGHGKKTQLLIKRLTADNHGLVLENKSMKNDLMKLTQTNTSAINLKKDYEDMNRGELLQKISSLEQRLKVEENRPVSKEDEANVDQENIDDRCIQLKGPLPQQIKQLRSREKELLTDSEKHEATIKKLKEDRAHYRKLTDDLRQQLDELNAVKDSSSRGEDKLKSERDDVVTARKDEETPAPLSVRSSTASPKLLRKKSSAITPRKPSTLDRHKKANELKEKNAARTIQRQWRKTKQENQNDQQVNAEEEFDDAVLSIQSAWRGHHSRQSLLQSSKRQHKNDDVIISDEENDDDDILLIQSAMRGHTTRKQLLNKKQIEKKKQKLDERIIDSADEERPISDVRRSRDTPHGNSRDMHVISESSDDDDDVVIGSSISLTKYRDNNKNSKISQQKPNLKAGLNESQRKKRGSYRDEEFNGQNNYARDTARNLSAKNDRRNDDYRNERHSDRNERYNRKSDIGDFIDDDEMQRKFNKNDPRMSISELKQSSSPWSNVQDETEEETEEEKPRKYSSKNPKRKNKQSMEPKRDNVTIKWANSGSSKNIDEKKRNSKRSPLDDESEDEFVMAPSFQKRLGSSIKKKSNTIDDELF